MGNRNAAKHLILVASILLCFFAYMGYRFLGPGSDTAPEQDTTAGTTTSLPGLTPPGGGELADEDIGGWVPTLAGGDLPLETGNGPVVMPPPPGVPANSSASVSTPHSGAITGLVPSPPATGAPLRPSSAGSLPIPVPGSGTQPPALAGSESIPSTLKPPGGGSASSGLDTSPSENGFPPSSGDSGFVSTASSSDGWTSLPFDDEDSTGNGLTPDNSTASAASPASPMGSSAPLRPTSAPGGSMPSRSIPTSTARDGMAPPATVTSRSAGATVPGAGMAGTAVTRPVSPMPGPSIPEEEDGLDLSGSESLRIYVVLPGDTLTSIAARELGAASLADNIFLLNRDVIPDPNQLMAGSKIRLPVRNAVTPGNDAGGQAYPGRRPTQGLGNTHTVVRGDTLSSISQQYYGTSTAWRQLHEANRNTLPNPNQLVVGMELTIPPFDELPR